MSVVVFFGYADTFVTMLGKRTIQLDEYDYEQLMFLSGLL
jgi:hypothetical protein